MLKVYAATGHRPDKLGGYSVAAFHLLVAVATTYLQKKRPDKIISGMALGWDMAWAQAGIDLNIPVTAAVPFKGQESMWPESSQELYHKILSQCSEVVFVCDPGYASWKMQARNKWMVDNSTKLIAMWDGTQGGTANCLKYADSKNRRVFNLFPKWYALWEKT